MTRTNCDLAAKTLQCVGWSKCEITDVLSTKRYCIHSCALLTYVFHYDDTTFGAEWMLDVLHCVPYPTRHTRVQVKQRMRSVHVGQQPVRVHLIRHKKNAWEWRHQPDGGDRVSSDVVPLGNAQTWSQVGLFSGSCMHPLQWAEVMWLARWCMQVMAQGHSQAM